MPIYRITCYNGTVFEMQGYISDIVETFKKKTGMFEMDIKFIEQLH